MASNRITISTGYICRACSRQSKDRTYDRRFVSEYRRAFTSQRTSLIPRVTSRQASTTVTLPTASPNKKLDGAKQTKPEQGFYGNQWTIFSASNEALVRKAQEFGNRIVQSKGIPTEDETLNALLVIDSAARQLAYDAKSALEQSGNPVQKDSTPASALLALGHHHKTSDSNPMSISISADLLSKLAYKIVTHPAVFLNPKILAAYVSIQAALCRPDSFPETFTLYQNKPSAVKGKGDVVEYKGVNPNAASQAIPAEVANSALESAIQRKDLLLALDIIQNSYAAPSFRRSKFVRLALPPMTLMGLAPVAAYIAGSKLATDVLNVDPTQFTMITVAGATTYIGVISTLAFVTITTANDQMERITWAQGTPLRERWMREEERAAVDRVAVAWGFKSLEKRGEESGEEWDCLREWCGVRQMELDRTDLMEGME